MSCKRSPNSGNGNNSKNTIVRNMMYDNIITLKNNKLITNDYEKFKQYESRIIDAVKSQHPMFYSSFNVTGGNTLNLFDLRTDSNVQDVGLSISKDVEKLSHFAEVNPVKMLDIFNETNNDNISLGINVTDGVINIIDIEGNKSKDFYEKIVKEYNNIKEVKSLENRIANNLRKEYGDSLLLKANENGIEVQSKNIEEDVSLKDIKNEAISYNNNLFAIEQNFSEENVSPTVEAESGIFESDKAATPKKKKRPNVSPSVYKNYRTYLENQIFELNKQIKNLRSKRKDLNTSQDYGKKKDDLENLTRQINTLITEQARLKKQFDSIPNNSSVEALYNNAHAEIDKLSEMLDSISPANVQSMEQRIMFMYSFVTGTNYGDNTNSPASLPRDPKLITEITALMHKFNRKSRSIIETVLNEDIVFNESVLNNDKFKDENGELLGDEIWSLFTSEEDINHFEKYLLGIGRASSHETLYPMFIKGVYEKNMVMEYSKANKLLDRLRNAVSGITDGKFDFIFERFESGARTGNIIDKYSHKWRKELSNYYKILKDNKLTPSEKYKRRIKWLKENAEVIDIRKLKFVKELFGDGNESIFSFSDEEMEAYEDELKQKLGAMYEVEMDRVHTWIDNYTSSSEILSNNAEKIKINPFSFLRKYYSRKPAAPMPVKNEDGKKETVYPDLTDVVFIPKTTKEFAPGIIENTGFYNEDFNRNIEGKPERIEYWKTLRNIYSNHINPTYDIGAMSYAKILKEFAENVDDSKGLGKVGTFMKESIQTFRSMFYEVGRGNKEDTGVVANYNDTSKQAIKDLMISLKTKERSEIELMASEIGLRNYSSLTLNQLIYEVASEVTLKNYSMDINKITAALVEQAAIHRARLNTLPIADIMFKAHSKIKGANGLERTKSIEKLKFYIDKVIKNRNDFFRGTKSVAGKEIKANWLEMLLNKFGELPFIKRKLEKGKFLHLLNNQERQLLKELQQAREKGHNDKVNDRFFFEGKTFSLRILSDGTKEYTEAFEEDGEKVFLKIDSKRYENYFQRMIQKKINDLGLDLNLSGIVQGMLKMLIFKSLGLNPIGGIFNRLEGKNTNLIMDMTGAYWTRGNAVKADSFLTFSNILHIAPERLSPDYLKKYRELEKFRTFLEKVRLIQDRKNPFERSNEMSKFSMEKYTNLYSWAVDNPEFKNQGTIILAILMDTKVKDINGNEVPIFNGSEMTIYEDSKDGMLRLKPEFRTEENIRNWENMEIANSVNANNQYYLTRLKMKDAISRTQGNYDDMDSIMASRNVLGQTFVLFKKWMFEHLMQRFESGENFNYYTGKKYPIGRYRMLLKSNPALMVSGAAGMLVSMGLGAGVLATGSIAGIASFFYIKNLFNGNKGIKEEANGISGLIKFTKAIAISALNYPIEAVFKKTIIDGAKYDGYGNTNLSEDEIGALRGMAKEIAVRLSYLALILLAKSLTWGADDDDDSDERKFHNFLDNQLNRGLASLEMYSHPLALKNDASVMSFMLYLDNLGKLTDAIAAGDDNKIYKYSMKALPLPNAINKTLAGDMLWEDDKEYDGGKTSWDILVMDYKTDGEITAKKEYEAKRSEIKADLTEQGLDEKEIRKKLGSKPKEMNFKEALGHLESEGHLPYPEKKPKGRPKGSKNKKKRE